MLQSGRRMREKNRTMYRYMCFYKMYDYYETHKERVGKYGKNMHFLDLDLATSNLESLSFIYSIYFA